MLKRTVVSMRCDPIALATRYTQCAPINLALCSTVMHSKPRSVPHCQAQKTLPHCQTRQISPHKAHSQAQQTSACTTTPVSGGILAHCVALEILAAFAKFTRT